jgi:hypothetical protein
MWRFIIDATKRYYHCSHGTTGDDDAGNVLADNGMEPDTLNGSRLP